MEKELLARLETANIRYVTVRFTKPQRERPEYPGINDMLFDAETFAHWVAGIPTDAGDGTGPETGPSNLAREDNKRFITEEIERDFNEGVNNPEDGDFDRPGQYDDGDSASGWGM